MPFETQYGPSALLGRSASKLRIDRQLNCRVAPSIMLMLYPDFHRMLVSIAFIPEF